MVGSEGRGRRRALSSVIAAVGLLAGLVSAALAASTDFSEPATSPVAVGAGPRAIVAVDLDNDGDRDLATANISGGNVTVLRNNGRARFVEFATSPEDAGSFPSGLVAADIDGDDDQDLAVMNQVSNDVTILRNNGSGNFVEPATSPEPAGNSPFAIAAADLDGDADEDLAVTNGGAADTVTILRNNGSGNFTQPPSSPEATGDDPTSVVAVDLDGDLDRDLAITNQQNFTVTILLNNGAGDFDEPASSPELAETFPQAVTAVDIDGDTDRDLVVSNQGSDNLTIMRNVGGGNFVQPASSPEPVGDRPIAAAAAADFDADGDQDLAVPNTDDANVTILRNSGIGNFGEPPTSPEGVGALPNSIATGDLDGDGDPDLAVPNQNGSNVTILRNR